MKKFLPLAFLLVSFNTFCQIKACLDAPSKPKSNIGSAESGVYSSNLKWTNGTAVKVKFLAGDPYVQSQVKYYVRDWEKYANIRFDFIESGNADIRISFEEGKGCWSQVGTDAVNIPQGQATMNYGWLTKSSTPDEYRAIVLHEFGHALGLLHEHKSPHSKIRWNLPVIYNYYMTTQGWSKERVDREVIERYSVDLSNHEYDPTSIMHYPVPANHTLDGYSVGWNTKLSAGDIKLIGELYPFFKKIKPINTGTTTTPSTNKAISVSLDKVDVAYNVTEGGKKGMKLYTTFTISNAYMNNCLLAAYFYYSKGTALEDKNGVYNSANGKVAVSKHFAPAYNPAYYERYEMFIPYDELHLGQGKFDLKFSLTLWDQNSREITTGGTYYFTYESGASSSKPEVFSQFENNYGRMTIMPRITVTNAVNKKMWACAYLFYNNGTAIKKSNGDNVYFCKEFYPASYISNYNYGYWSDLYIYVPYTELFLSRGFYNLKYYVAIFEGDKQIATSDWQSFTYTQP